MSDTRPAILSSVIGELDVIELLRPVGLWGVGTRGTVHEVSSDALLVEISDDHGATLDLITVPIDGATVVWSMDEHRCPRTSEDVRGPIEQESPASRVFSDR